MLKHHKSEIYRTSKIDPAREVKHSIQRPTSIEQYLHAVRFCNRPNGYTHIMNEIAIELLAEAYNYIEACTRRRTFPSHTIIPYIIRLKKTIQRGIYECSSLTYPVSRGNARCSGVRCEHERRSDSRIFLPTPCACVHKSIESRRRSYAYTRNLEKNDPTRDMGRGIRRRSRFHRMVLFEAAQFCTCLDGYIRITNGVTIGPFENCTASKS